jgi:hypothetical protein
MKVSEHRYEIAPVLLAGITVVFVCALLASDVLPKAFSPTAHDLLGALPLVSIALTYLLYQALRRATTAELVKATLLAGAFLLWAANQFWPNSKSATLFNDLAIALFVFDIFLVVVGWPATSIAEAFNFSTSKNSNLPEG